MDHILYEGTTLYTGLGYTTQYSSVDDLPSHIRIKNKIVQVQKLNNKVKLISRDDSFLERINAENDHGAICIIARISFSIIRKRGQIYLFDSHSRNCIGQIVDDGK